ncbi:MAG: hypothetical protein FWD43_04380, partial [Coriobacteriia bacterium]|nr:hypothetical protein [Coriobacteriia bacterium]
MTSYHGSLYRDLPLVGAVTVPGDKSLSHRVALFAALAEGTSQVRGLLDSFDVRSTLDAVAALGAVVDVSEDGSGGLSGSITGWGKVGAAAPAALMNSGNFGGEGAAAPAALIDCRNSSGEGIAAPVVQIDCGNSGTTTRLLLGLLSGYPLTVQLTGDESLSRRPMKRVTEPLRTMGACFTQTAATPLPLIVQGSTHLSAIDYHSPVASAQVKSAVLLAGLHAKGTTTVTEPRLSRNHTELLLPAFGVEVKVSDDGLTTSILGGQNAKACDCVVPKDPSSAAFLLAAAALIPGSCVTARGISLNPTRTGFLSVMRRMGVKIAIVNSNLGSFGDEPIESFEDETIESFEDEVGGSAGADSMESLGAEPRGKLGAESKGGLGAESRGMLGAESKGGPGAESKRSIGAEPVGDVCVCYTRELKAVTVAADEIPSLIDEIPILALLA